MRIQLLLIVILLAASAHAKTYHITLLTIGEVGEETVGGIADAYLEIRPGSGRIFLDSFPLTKLDTQISTRYANKVACDYIDANCDNKDFFYTIRADSTIVGGPSASGPLTVLTIAALEGLKLDNSTVMTGTINSGGSIGPVGGIEKKAAAAQRAGFEKILIPRFSIRTTNQTPTLININATIINNSNTTEISIQFFNESEIDIEIINISNIEEAVYQFTGVLLNGAEVEPDAPEQYQQTMRQVALDLCSRTRYLMNKTKLRDSEMNKSESLTEQITISLDNQNYYSAASFCFNLGVLARKAALRGKEPSELAILSQTLKNASSEFSSNLEAYNLTTITELETYIIVKERLVEVEEYLQGNYTSEDIAYAIERYYSAVHWSRFFGIAGRRVNLDREYLREACYKKISEAEERASYADLYLPKGYSPGESDLKSAYLFMEQENFKMCLFKASFAKAQSNMLLSSIAVDADQISQLAKEKIESAAKLISKEKNRDFFPILGYSYYEYSKSLLESGDELTSLIFSEYALELANIEIYFPKQRTDYLPLDYSFVRIALISLGIGLIVGALVMSKATKRINPKKTSDRGLPGKKR